MHIIIIAISTKHTTFSRPNIGATRSFLISRVYAMSLHSRSDHDAETMGSLIIILIVVTVYCSETQCRTSPNLKIAVTKPEDAGLVEKNNTHAIEKGIFWKNLDLPNHKPMRIEESRSLNNKTNNRKSRLLGSLAFLAGLGFGGLASAASSTAKTIAKLPETSFNLNIGSKGSPYLAYYNPYSLLPYPFFFPGPIGFAPMINVAKPQSTSHNDLMPQVISVFDNRQSIDLAEDNEEYLDEEKKKSKNDKNTDNGEDDRIELRAKVDRNAEEKIHGCKENQQKYGNSFKGSTREREDLQVDADDSQATLDFQTVNMTAADRNQTVIENATMALTTSPPRIIFGSLKNDTFHFFHHHHYNSSYYTEHPPYSGYYGGYPQNVNHVDLTTGLNPHYDNQINYNLPHEQPANFYHNDKYYTYSNLNPPFSGPFSPDQVNEYTGPDVNRLLHHHSPEYQTYNNGFKPVT
ncbi:uncharacterized protein LOC114933503 [Nylanderia fulva]|uniref:uncharacterized protein LOC114933503 n=1 Tax=Nylanderia fulva TaxID=613905 RepID=UPI0010FAD36A|nr:uncharacterized protein LOC114933503 [Nylanderia fulva]